MPKLYISITISLYGMGLSVNNIHQTLMVLSITVHVDTITRWLEHYVDRVEKYTDTLKPPCPGEQWGCDEKRYHVNGKDWWIVAVMDLSSRFILAWDVSATKQKYNAVPLLKAAKRKAGKIPRMFITDGLPQFSIAFKKVFRTLKNIHIRDIHIRNHICNTNEHVRLNGEFADRFRSARGIKKSDFPHSGTPQSHSGIGNKTPAVRSLA